MDDGEPLCEECYDECDAADEAYYDECDAADEAYERSGDEGQINDTHGDATIARSDVPLAIRRSPRASV